MSVSGLLVSRFEAYKIIRGLMDSHGLNNWCFKLHRYSSTRGELAHCNKEIKVISFQVNFLEQASPDDIEDTAKHEIAHALVADNGHGYDWRAKATEIGCRHAGRYS